MCRSCSSFKRFNPSFSLPEEKKTKRVNAVEFVYCGCGCRKTKPKYDKVGIAKAFITGHYIRTRKRVVRRIRNDGYVLVHLPEHPFCDVYGYVLEHRYVMEQFLGRYLTKEEVVHHKDRNTSNNDISNLELMIRGAHSRHHNKQDLSDRICKICNSNKTYTNKRGIKEWRRFEDDWICSSCRKKCLGKKVLNQSFLTSSL
jgi:hypothetical protein